MDDDTRKQATRPRPRHSLDIPASLRTPSGALDYDACRRQAQRLRTAALGSLVGKLTGVAVNACRAVLQRCTTHRRQNAPHR